MSEIHRQILVVKVGTSTLTKRSTEGLIELDVASFQRIGSQVIALRENGYDVIIVSSAAITAGLVATGTAQRPLSIAENMPKLQSLASIGWRHILNQWQASLADAPVGELLITRQELERTPEKSELLNVVSTLLSMGCVPIINENDAITHEEISFGDNDMLAVRFAVVLKRALGTAADVSVVILSDIDGVLKDINDSASVIKQIDSIHDYESVIDAVTSDGGTGGMAAKFKAAALAQANEIDLYITNGRAESGIERTLTGEIGTQFKAAKSI